MGRLSTLAAPAAARSERSIRPSIPAPVREPGAGGPGERRRAERSRLDSPVGIQIVDSGGWRISGISIDRSATGLGVYAWSPLDPGTVVITSLGSFTSPSPTMGVVRRCTLDAKGAYRLGIESE